MTDDLTCQQIRERDWLPLYVAGRLAEDDAEAIERHTLSCESCWSDMQQAIELRAALIETGDRRPTSTQRPRAARAGLALAATLLVSLGAAVAYRHFAAPRDAELVRGASALVDATATWQQDGSLKVEWTPVTDASVYRVQIGTATGADIVREVTGSPLTIPPPEAASFAGATIQLDAENAAGEVVGRSSIVDVPPRSR